MRFVHADHPGRAVRLAYCMNVHPAETLEELYAGLETITLPLRDRLAQGREFGIGMYFAAELAEELADHSDHRALNGLSARLLEEGLEPFTFNAFPYGGFHRDGLKEGVYRPTWLEQERHTFTNDVIDLIAGLWTHRDYEWGKMHLSVSTHPGSYADWIAGPKDLHDLARGFSGSALFLTGSSAGGPHVVLCLEAEPRASANDQTELAEFLPQVRDHAAEAMRAEFSHSPEIVDEVVEDVVRAYGTCLDCCHAAVEFEDPAEAFRLATAGGPIGKLQFSSALALPDPGANAAGREALLAMDEPRYLHQVTGVAHGVRVGASDLPELAEALRGDGRDRWLACDEWRCHFHVPVDLAEVAGLSTTRAHAEATLRAALGQPERWGTNDLHVEIETYTWDVLPTPARGAGALVDGLEREYRAAIAVLEGAGWRLA